MPLYPKTTDPENQKGGKMQELTLKNTKGEIIFASKTAADTKGLVEEAVRKGICLEGVALDDENLSGINLKGVSLEYASFVATNLEGAIDLTHNPAISMNLGV